MERFGVTPRRNMGWDWGHLNIYGMRSLGSSYEEWNEDFGVSWGDLGHPKGEQNGMERLGVTPRRNMGWDWGHPNIYGMGSLGSS